MKLCDLTKILIASNNQGKIREIGDLLANIGVDSVSPSQIEAFRGFKEPKETGSTFAQNSLIKARFYAKKSGLVSLADDSGFCVDALDGQPGVYSARFALNEKGETDFGATFEKIFKMLAKKGLDCEKDAIKCHFICNLTLFDPNSDFHISFEGRVDGEVVKPRGEKGFGYDPIFVKNGLDKSFGEISAGQKDKISHRGDAFQQLISWLRDAKN